MDTEKSKQQNNIKDTYVCVLECLHNREIGRLPRIDQVFAPLTQNELLIADMPYISLLRSRF